MKAQPWSRSSVTMLVIVILFAAVLLFMLGGFVAMRFGTYNQGPPAPPPVGFCHGGTAHYTDGAWHCD